MTLSSSSQFTSLQKTILGIVRKYPSQFTRSGLAKMLAGAKSWQDESFPEYGRFTNHTRKAVTTDVNILVQQGYLVLNGRSQLVPVTTQKQVPTSRFQTCIGISSGTCLRIVTRRRTNSIYWTTALGCVMTGVWLLLPQTGTKVVYRSKSNTAVSTPTGKSYA